MAQPELLDSGNLVLLWADEVCRDIKSKVRHLFCAKDTLFGVELEAIT